MSDTEKREPKFWSAYDDRESYVYQDEDEAIEEWWDDQEVLPDSCRITLYGFAPFEIQKGIREHFADLALETLLQRIDEDFGNPEESTDPTVAMKKSATQFVDAVLAEYHVWSCEIVKTIEIDVVRHGEDDWRRAGNAST